MRVQAQVQLTLQLQVHGLRQLAGDATQLGDVAAPVVPLGAVAPADQLHQAALSVNERHRHAIDLGLDPDIGLAGQPALHGVAVVQLVDARVGNGVGYRAARVGQGRRATGQAEALLQLREALAALVIKLIRYQGNALAMVVVVPAAKGFSQLGNLAGDLLGVPAGA